MDKKLPQEIVNRKKHGFLIPLAKWLSGELKEYTNDILINKSSFSARVLGLRRVKSLFGPHRGLKALEYKILLWRLLIFELWVGLYIKNNEIVN